MRCEKIQRQRVVDIKKKRKATKTFITFRLMLCREAALAFMVTIISDAIVYKHLFISYRLALLELFLLNSLFEPLQFPFFSISFCFSLDTHLFFQYLLLLCCSPFALFLGFYFSRSIYFNLSFFSVSLS